jgi:hypothetical protein
LKTAANPRRVDADSRSTGVVAEATRQWEAEPDGQKENPMAESPGYDAAPSCATIAHPFAVSHTPYTSPRYTGCGSSKYEPDVSLTSKSFTVGVRLYASRSDAVEWLKMDANVRVVDAERMRTPAVVDGTRPPLADPEATPAPMFLVDRGASVEPKNGIVSSLPP